MTYNAAQSAKMLARGISQGMLSHLRVGVQESISVNVLIGLFTRLNMLLEGLELTLVRKPARELIARMVDGEFDLLFLTSAVNLPETMRNWVLFAERLNVIVAKDHELAGKESISVADLAEIGMIEVIGCPDYQRFKEACFRSDVAFRTPHQVQGHDEMIRLVAAGFGVGIIPESFPIVSGVATRPLHHDDAQRSVTVAIVAGRPFLTATEACLRLARGQDWSSELPPVLN